MKNYVSEHSGIEIDKVDIQEYKILKDCVCTDDKEAGFYKFSQRTRERVSRILEPISQNTRREVLIPIPITRETDRQ